ncbi:hypothetical protein GCM10020358_41130 [Amorphoplanes nipponensis]
MVGPLIGVSHVVPGGPGGPVVQVDARQSTAHTGPVGVASSGGYSLRSAVTSGSVSGTAANRVTRWSAPERTGPHARRVHGDPPGSVRGLPGADAQRRDVGRYPAGTRESRAPRTRGPPGVLIRPVGTPPRTWYWVIARVASPPLPHGVDRPLTVASNHVSQNWESGGTPRAARRS